jgi:hypothetical protein
MMNTGIAWIAPGHRAFRQKSIQDRRKSTLSTLLRLSNVGSDYLLFFSLPPNYSSFCFVLAISTGEAMYGENFEFGRD